MIYNMDCVTGVQEHLKDESVDLIVTDPPYNLAFAGTKHTKTKQTRFDVFANDQLSPREFQRFTYSWLREAYRVLKHGRHIYVCIDWRMYPLMSLWMQRVGFTVKNCIVWDKAHMGMGWQYRYRHEFIIMAAKGKHKARRISTRSETDIWRIPRIPSNQTVHPTEKPIELFRKMVDLSSIEGELVVDLFTGAGASAVAAKETGREYLGFEIDECHFKNAYERVKLK